MWTVDADYKIQQPLAQFFVAQLINQEWVQPGSGTHEVFSTKSDVEDGAGHALVTAYAVKRPDGQWSLLLVNRDQMNSHRVRMAFEDASGSSENFAGQVEISTFGSGQYQWHPAQTRFMAHAEAGVQRTIVAYTKGTADPDGPILHAKQSAGKDTEYELPAASVTVIRGKVAAR